MITYEHLMITGAIAATAAMIGCIIGARIAFWGERMFESWAWSIAAGLGLNFLFCLSALSSASARISAERTLRYEHWLFGMAAVAIVSAAAGFFLHRRRKNAETRMRANRQPIATYFRR